MFNFLRKFRKHKWDYIERPFQHPNTKFCSRCGKQFYFFTAPKRGCTGSKWEWV